jgi:acyl-CoA thioesterase FadM
MPRQLRTEWAFDTSQFTPHQFQARSLLSVSFNVMWDWMRTHFISFRRSIQEHGLSWVIIRAEIDYHDRVGYFDADGFEAVVEKVALRRNRMLEFHVEFRIPDKRIATSKILLLAVKVGDQDSLSALPGKVDHKIWDLLSPDEIHPTVPARVVPSALEQIQQYGTPIAEGLYPFTVHRHLCEVADQWCFVELAGLVGAGRESLVTAHPSQGADLLRGLSEPMKSLRAELRHAYFLFDEGRVETTSYVLDERAYFVHRLLGGPKNQEPYATVIEEF